MGDDTKVNDTIIKMVTNFKPKVTGKLFDFDLSSSSKRSMGSFFDSTPAKRMCLAQSDMTYIGSPREVRRLRTDLLESRNTVTILESRIEHMHTVRKEMEIMYAREMEDLKLQYRTDKQSIRNLEDQLQSIRQREKTVSNELDELKTKYTTLMNESEIKVQELESEVANNSMKLDAHDSEENSEIVMLKRKLTEMEKMYKAAKEEAESYIKLGDDLRGKLKEQTKYESIIEIKETALNKANLRIKELEFTRESYLEFQQLSKSQQHKLSTHAGLERENQKLKEETRHLKNEVYNKLVLEEEVNDLKNRLVNSKEQEQKYIALQVTNAQSEALLEEFCSLARTTCETSASNASLPRVLRSLIENLQQKEITLTSEKIQMESQFNVASHDAKIAQHELGKTQIHITELKSTVQQQKSFLHRLQKKLQLLTGERDSYRKQLDSYERDLTICFNPASTANPGQGQLESQFERIQNLEKIVNEYRDMVHKLELDLQEAQPGLHLEQAPVRLEQLSRIQDELDKVKNENVLLRERKDQLEIQMEQMVVGQDAFTARIVHNANNPLTACLKQRECEKEKLQEEVERLKRKIKLLEEGLEASKLGDVTIDHKQVEALREQVKSSESQLQRLKEYFKSSMQEFRNVIYMLLGYKIDKISSSNYKLTSMFADSPDDVLCFYYKDGELNMLENEFSLTLEKLVKVHLQKHDSIPMFLSSITIQLFNSRTMTKTCDVDEEESCEEVEEEEDEEEEDDD